MLRGGSWNNNASNLRSANRNRNEPGERNNEQTEVTLTLLEDAARSTDNLLPRILACVEAHATVGEISHRLRRVWGEYREAVTV